MATVPVTRTWVAGEIVTAGHFNTNIRDVLLYLLAKPILQVRQTAAQSISNSSWTGITFTTEDVDSSGMHSTSSNTNRAIAVYPGWYSVSAGVGLVSNSTGLRGARFAKNAVAIDPGGPVDNATNGNASFKVASSVLVFLTVGQYVEIQGFQSSGGALNTEVASTIQSFLTVKWESN